MYISEMFLNYRAAKGRSVRATVYTSLSFWSRKCYEMAMLAVSVSFMGGLFQSPKSKATAVADRQCQSRWVCYLGMSLNSGACFTFLFCSEVRRGSGDCRREWLEGVGCCFMSMLTIAALNHILRRSIEREWNDWDVWRLLEGWEHGVWRLFVRWKHGSVTLVCELRMWMCVCLWDENMDVWRLFVSWECGCVCEMKIWKGDACLWAENVEVCLFVRWKCGCVRMYMCDAWVWAESVDVCLFVRWKYGCMTLVCDMRMWMCVCLWDENVDVWEYMCDAWVWAENVDVWLFVRCKCGCMRMYMCDAWVWAENVDVWRSVRWKYGCMTLVCELRMWRCVCLWDENMEVWRFFVSWECGCVSVCEMKMWMCENVRVWRFGVSWECGCMAVREMKIWMCDSCMWAETVDLWRLFVDENADVVVIGGWWRWSLYQFILKLETALRYLLPDITVSHFGYEGICSPPVVPWLSIPIAAKIIPIQFGVRGFVQ